VNPITKSQMLKALLTALTLAFTLAGCSVNPVTGERQLSIIPENQELSMGAEQYKPTQQTQGGLFYLDPELTVYVREVGMKLAAVSDRPDLPYDFVVLNSSVPNAWALPGGKIAINRGLLTRSAMKPSWPRCWATRLCTPPLATVCSVCSRRRL